MAREFKNPELNQNKQLSLFLVGWIGFRILATIIQYMAIAIFQTDSALSRADVSMSLNCICYAILFTVLVILLGDKSIKEHLVRFKVKDTYFAGLVCVAAILGFNFVYNIILSVVKTPVADNLNETAITTMTDIYRVPSIIFFGIVGPICEELTYRVGLFNLCKRKSKTFAYIVTMVFFSLIHFNFVPGHLVNELLNLPFYCFAALAFSYTYDNYGFEASLTAHIINNQLSLALISFVK